MSQVPIILRYKGSYFDKLGQHRICENWLTSRKIEHTFMFMDSYIEPEIPHVIVLSDGDAIAFKLRFGL
jgi:hypothetical protein